ncbi:MAG: DUF1489 domain-containing protein [Hyphomicrobiales bacterium]
MNQICPRTIHLLKLCVGVASIDGLARLQAERLRRGEELAHITRMTPRRAEDLIAGGSIYWVIAGRIQLRQRIIDIRPFTDREGISRCRLVFDSELVAVRPVARRAFQGWRYLEPEDAPDDLPESERSGDLPDAMRNVLIELGLL